MKVTAWQHATISFFLGRIDLVGASMLYIIYPKDHRPPFSHERSEVDVQHSAWATLVIDDNSLVVALPESSRP
jgi:hypothetical protein